METTVRRLSVAATIGMFLVLIMGATVTNTGSSEGCGRSWPLCHGEFIPAYAFETAVEFSHRLVTGIEGILILAVSIGAILRRRGRRDVKVYVAIMIGTLFLQSGLGAAAVMWPQSPFLMASHFGISMVCLASVFLLTRVFYETSESRTATRSKLRTPSLPTWYRWATWGALLAAIGVAYIGAYMRHSNATLACYRWPACTNETIPDLNGPVLVALSHRFSALALMVLVGVIAWYTYKRRTVERELYIVNGAAFILILLQAASGGAVVLTRLATWSPLLHAAFMALLFICLADACRQITQRSWGVVESEQRLPLSSPATQQLSPGD